MSHPDLNAIERLDGIGIRASVVLDLVQYARRLETALREIAALDCTAQPSLDYYEGANAAATIARAALADTEGAPE